MFFWCTLGFPWCLVPFFYGFQVCLALSSVVLYSLGGAYARVLEPQSLDLAGTKHKGVPKTPPGGWFPCRTPKILHQITVGRKKNGFLKKQTLIFLEQKTKTKTKKSQTKTKTARLSSPSLGRLELTHRSLARRVGQLCTWLPGVAVNRCCFFCDVFFFFLMVF